MRGPWLTLLALLVGGCAQDETRLTQDTFQVDPTLLPGCIALSTERLTFEAAVGASDERVVKVDSTCDGVLELREVLLDDGATPFEVDVPQDRTLEPNAQADILVRFEPLVAGSFADRLFIDTNDEDLPRAEVVLSGEAP